MNIMKDVKDQFVDKEEKEQHKQEVKTAASKTPSDVILEHANETYTQRFCTYCLGL